MAIRKQKKQPLTSMIKGIVKKEAQKEEETKKAVFSINSLLTKQQITSYNLMYDSVLNQGVLDGKLVGNEFRLKGIRVRVVCSNPASSNDTQQYTLALVATDRYATITNLSNLDVMDSRNNLSYPPNFDSQKCNVLWRKELTSRPQIANSYDSKGIDAYCKQDRRVIFRDPAISYELKGKNLYFLVYSNNRIGTPGVTGTGTMEGQIDLYYKDS